MTTYLKKRKVWFIGDDLCWLYHKGKGSTIVTIENITAGTFLTMTYKDWKTIRTKAFSIKATATILGRNNVHFGHLIRDGKMPEPVAAVLGGKRRKNGTNAYYNEKMIYEMREIFASTHHGRPRKDGLISPYNVPTESEVRARIAGKTVTYVYDAEGVKLPIFDSPSLGL